MPDVSVSMERSQAERRFRALFDVAALRTAPRWTVVKELSRQGHYDEVLQQYVDAVAAGRTLTVEQSYKDALGC